MRQDNYMMRRIKVERENKIIMFLTILPFFYICLILISIFN
jgi:hypothetical protein